MTDDPYERENQLDAALRVRLDQHDIRASVWNERERGALLAVLDWHPVEAHECPGGEDGHGQITAFDKTCPTRRAIAKALLGTEVPGD